METLTLLDARRLPNSLAGNPRYQVALDTGTGVILSVPTVPNTGDAYAISASWIGKRVRVSLRTYRGRMQCDRIGLAS
jgi:hypothetical protein